MVLEKQARLVHQSYFSKSRVCLLLSVLPSHLSNCPLCTSHLRQRQDAVCTSSLILITAL